MNALAKAWDEVLRCFDACTRAANIDDEATAEAKHETLLAIHKYADVALESRIQELEIKPKPQPDQRTCIKCEGTEHRVKFIEEADSSYHREYWPNHEHLRFTCTRCNFQSWRHCADHVEEGTGECP